MLVTILMVFQHNKRHKILLSQPLVLMIQALKVVPIFFNKLQFSFKTVLKLIDTTIS